MEIREYFYSSLRDEYVQHGDESFLFRFMREARLKASSEEPGRRKDFSQMPLDGLLGLLTDRNRTLSLRKRDQDWLCDLGERAGGAQLREALERTHRERTQYQLIQKALADHPEVVRKKELEKLRLLVLNAMVRQDAKAFLYDAGFPLPQENPRAVPQKGRAVAKKDRMLEMLNEWGRAMGYSLCRNGEAGSGGLTEEQRAAWNEMFRLLQGMEEPTDVVLPVQVDPSTGAGLYLVGIDCYPAEEMEKLLANQQKCQFVCLIPYDLPNPDHSGALYLCMAPFEAENAIACVNLKDGERMFSEIQRSQLAYDFFRERHDTAPAGTPELLQVYFQPTEQTSLIAEGRWESEQDRKRHPAP